MKKQIGLIIIIIIIALVICLLTWRFWPQSSSNLISVDDNCITNFSAHAMVVRFENGQFYTDTYRIDNTAQQSSGLGEIIAILATSSYQQDFRNLLPWGIDSVGGGKDYDGRTVRLALYIEGQEDKYVDIQFMSSSIIAVSVGDESGFRIYHPTNLKILDKLIEYLQTHGVKQQTRHIEAEKLTLSIAKSQEMGEAIW